MQNHLHSGLPSFVPSRTFIQNNQSTVSKVDHIAAVFSTSLFDNNSLGVSAINGIVKNSMGKNSQRFQYDKQRKESKEKSLKVLKQKYNLQQVSSLYSEHIYKSVHRDYFHQAQLDKYKMMLDNEKKQKMKLLAEQNEWKLEKIKLMEEKQIILFALDSLTVKLDSDHNSKKNKQLRRQTAQILKSKYYSSDSSNKEKSSQIRFKTDPESMNSCSIRDSYQFEGNSTLEKLKKIKSIKERLNIQNNDEVSNIIHNHEEKQEKYIELQAQFKETEVKISQLEGKNEQILQKVKQKQQEIEELLSKNSKQQKQKQQLIKKLEMSEQKSKNLQIKLQNQQISIQRLINQKQKIQERVRDLQKQLKITHDQYNFREQKQKQCVKLLHKFSKDLKLSDDKIQQFLQTEVNNYTEQNSNDLSRSKKIYNQHLSYILHLCKKKQTLYENLVEQFKQKIEQNQFRFTILQKKLTNFTQYQQKLRDLVVSDSDKNTVFKTIIKFGY